RPGALRRPGGARGHEGDPGVAELLLQEPPARRERLSRARSLRSESTAGEQPAVSDGGGADQLPRLGLHERVAAGRLRAAGPALFLLVPALALAQPRQPAPAQQQQQGAKSAPLTLDQVQELAR